MADPIRPHSWPNLPAAPARTGGPADARSAAQRAFFEQALGRSTAPAAATQKAAAASPLAIRPRGPDLRIELPDAPPAKILRPGSIIDIKV